MPLPPKRDVFLDGDGLAKRCIQATAGDDLKAGIKPSGGIYTTLRGLIAILRNGTYGAGHVTACFDQGVPEYRAALLPEYKSDRAARRDRWTPEEKALVYGQMEPIREMCGLLGMTVARFPNWEADDLIARAVRDNAKRCARRPLVVTGDRDVFQSVGFGADVLYLKDDTLLTPTSFRDIVGVDPHFFTLFKILVGKADHHAGAHGCGEARATDTVNRLAMTCHSANAHEQLDALVRILLRTRGRKKWESEIIRDRPRLHNCITAIGFDEAALRAPEIPPHGSGKVDRDGFVAFCKQWSFKTILAELPRIIPLFEVPCASA